ncbi:adhesin-like protein [Reticulomyxa filosa]|uniref:Adhesin-like protein n=1 Tax=Reticulomyxa filosa TaxID=46433 RepID=X6N4L5_RETFI|nr:adhesin-like protein [Reticulomyxa filosa]|eukprot:ETO21235.1 adhesin-like protein [Reticulomyxa filosa]
MFMSNIYMMCIGKNTNKYTTMMTTEGVIMHNVTIYNNTYHSGVLQSKGEFDRGTWNLSRCNFENNYGGMFISDGTRASIEHSKIIGFNPLSDSLGFNVLIDEVATVVFDSCVFENNNGDHYGGGALRVDNVKHSLTITQTVFMNNNAYMGGAIMSIHTPVVALSSCIFYNNSASQDGGAVYFDYPPLSSSDSADVHVSAFNTSFILNVAGFKGGAIHSSLGVLQLEKCLLSDNSGEFGMFYYYYYYYYYY